MENKKKDNPKIGQPAREKATKNAPLYRTVIS